MRLKSEFRRRLVRLYRVLGSTLASDIQGECNDSNLLPFLFQVYSYLWSHKHEDLFKK